MSDALPFISMNAERAARRILKACRDGTARVILGAHTKGAVLFNELLPGAMTTLLSAANLLLPNAKTELGTESYSGFASQSKLAPSWLTQLSRRAARRNNELPFESEF